MAARRYIWTPELLDALRLAHCGNKAALGAEMDRLQRKTGWPRHAFKYKAERLGWTAQYHRWSAADDAYLREKAGVVSTDSIARKLGRSRISVASRADKLGLSRRPGEGYTIADLTLVFGAPPYKVRRWMERGLLGKVHQNGGSRVAEPNVVQFIRRYPDEYDLRRVDQGWYKAMLFGGLAAYGGRI